MIWTRSRNHRTAHRIDAAVNVQFPASGRQQLAFRHPTLTGEDIDTVEAATRQWFRLLARHPRAKLSMPSVVVADLCEELARHPRDYAAFCHAAFGRVRPNRSRPATIAGTANADRGAALLATFGYARRDDGCGPTDLPLLFRVDSDLRIRDGHRYLADCGGRGECFHVAGMICLQHVGGLGKRRRVHDIRRHHAHLGDMRSGHPAGVYWAGVAAGEASGGYGDFGCDGSE